MLKEEKMLMKYPQLKCEEKLNTRVCSLDIKKMKQLRKRGFTYQKIADSLKITIGPVLYHISPSQNSVEARERKKKYVREYQKRRYQTDPKFRRKMLDSINKSHARRRKNNPNYKKWEQQGSYLRFKNWKEKRQKIHPNWSSTCIIGSHVTTNHESKCLNFHKTCKCPCHKR